MSSKTKALKTGDEISYLRDLTVVYSSEEVAVILGFKTINGDKCVILDDGAWVDLLDCKLYLGEM